MRRALPISALLLLLLTSLALAQAKLEFKRQEGSVTTQSTIKVHQVLNIAGMDVETDADHAITSRTTVGKARPDGTIPVEEKTESIKVRFSLPGAMKVEFDSSKPDAAKSDVAEIQAILDGLRATAGASYTVVLGKDGKVTAVEGIQKILDKAPASAAEGLKAQFSVERLKQAMDQTLGVLPDGPVKKGERWKRIELMDIGGGQMLTFENYYEYQGTVEKDGKTYDKIAIFSNTVRYAPDPNPNALAKVINSDFKIESSSGSLLFDREQGMIVERGNTLRIKGPITLSVNGMDIPATVDLTLDSFETTKR
jgi:hypothetical protein